VESLTISDLERDGIAAVSGLLGRSPRSVKRFVNLYRLIKAGLSPAVHEEFVRKPEGGLSDYEAVLFLLAVDVGVPRASRSVFEFLTEHQVEGSAHAKKAVQALLDRLEADAERDTPDTADYAVLRSWIAPRAESAGFNAESFDRLASWAPVVARYSFHSMALLLGQLGTSRSNTTRSNRARRAGRGGARQAANS
jgi:hypothetical protein